MKSTSDSTKSEKQWIPVPKGFLLEDIGANSWVLPYRVDESTEIVIKGKYPFCRYISYTIYGKSSLQSNSVTAYDQTILPNEDNSNPFLPGVNFNAENRKYTLIIRFTEAPDLTHPYVPSSGNNIMYTGGISNEGGFLVYRLYTPSAGFDETGGVDLPKVYIRKFSATENDQEKLDESLPNLLDLANSEEIFSTNSNLLQTFSKFLFENKNEDLIWNRQPAGVVPVQNPLSVNIYTFIKSDPNKILYLRWKVPTVPDTFQGKNLTGFENVRYWSMSIGRLLGMKTVQSIADNQAVIQDGYVNLVLGFGSERPPFVTPENGFTWVDLTNKQAQLLIYRNSLVGGFPFTAKDVPASENVTRDDLGPYLPVGKYLPANLSINELIVRQVGE